MTDNGWAVVGGLVKTRRERLGLNQEELRLHGGPAVSTVGKVERGAQASFPLRTQQQLENALGWNRGTIADVLETVAAGEWDQFGEERTIMLVEEGIPDLSRTGGEPVRRVVELSDAELLAELTHRVRQYAAALEAAEPARPQQTVVDELARRGKDAGWLMDAAGLDVDELGPFLESGVAPKARVVRAVENALGWRSGSLTASPPTHAERAVRDRWVRGA